VSFAWSKLRSEVKGVLRGADVRGSVEAARRRPESLSRVQKMATRATRRVRGNCSTMELSRAGDRFQS